MKQGIDRTPRSRLMLFNNFGNFLYRLDNAELTIRHLDGNQDGIFVKRRLQLRKVDNPLAVYRNFDNLRPMQTLKRHTRFVYGLVLDGGYNNTRLIFLF